MMRANFTLIFYLILAVTSVFCADNEQPEERNEKLISTFQIVRFPNDVCVGSNSRNGTCYTSAECSDKSGTSSGSCADGFGVCCTFLISQCGSSSSENNTYWTQPSTVSSGTCDLTICPTNDDICSIRLDFTTFVITGPNTRTAMTVYRIMGHPQGSITDETYGSTYAGQCNTDSFVVTGASPSTTPPRVCGTLTGQHVYVEADVDRCNRLVFHMADAAVSSITAVNSRGITSLATRTWDIRAQQIECTSLTMPPPGCTQYFWSSPTAATYTFRSANWVTSGTSWHLANQHDRFCFRRERGKCIGCMVATAVGNVMLSGSEGTSQHNTFPGGCCGYGTQDGGIFGVNANMVAAQGGGLFINNANVYQFGYDCVIIPGAQGPSNIGNIEGTVGTTSQTTALLTQTLRSATNNAFPMPWPPQICGNNGGLGIGSTDLEEAAFNFVTYDGVTIDIEFSATNINLSICTRNSPFVLEFMSDDVDGLGGETGHTEWEKATKNRGFELVSTQIDCA